VDFANASGGQDNVTVVVARPDLTETDDRIFSARIGSQSVSENVISDGIQEDLPRL
jgi:serine/threonine protein phosphatase PrpC